MEYSCGPQGDSLSQTFAQANLSPGTDNQGRRWWLVLAPGSSELGINFWVVLTVEFQCHSLFLEEIKSSCPIEQIIPTWN